MARWKLMIDYGAIVDVDKYSASSPAHLQAPEVSRLPRFVENGEEGILIG